MSKPVDRIGDHRACKPMLSGSRSLISGYAALHDQEARYTAIALQKMPEAVEVWYRYLNLFDRTMRREHDSGAEGPTAEWYSWNLRLRLAGTAIGTAKLTLDAGLAGYYSQAIGLIRHMLETWLQMLYVRTTPEEATRWYTSAEGKQPDEPGADWIIRTLTRRAKKTGDSEMRNNLAVCQRLLKGCNHGAHPSVMAAAQVETGKDGFLQLGANYIETQLASVMSLGTLSLALLIHELQPLIPLDETWREEFDAVGVARSSWHESYFGKPSGSSSEGGDA